MDNLKPIDQNKTIATNRPETSTRSEKDPRLWKAVKDFESILMFQMIKAMRETVMKSELTEDGMGEEFFTSIFDEHVARSIAQRQNDSLAESLYRQLANEMRNCTPAPPIKKIRIPQTIHNRLNDYQEMIRDAAKQFQVDGDLIRAVMVQESGGDPTVVSSKGARGLMQLMEDTAKEMGIQRIMEPKENIWGGTKYLKMLLDRYKGDLTLVLAGYNAGPSAVDKYGGIPPYPETQNYVKKVLAYYQKFKSESKDNLL